MVEAEGEAGQPGGENGDNLLVLAAACPTQFLQGWIGRSGFK